MQYLQGFINAFKVEDLRKKILFTLMVLVIYRLGCHIAIPGIDTARLENYFAMSGAGNIFGLYDSFTGGAFRNATIFALGIMPYISASIIFQLMGAVVPRIRELQREGQEGRAKVTQWTRYFTIALALVQSVGITTWLSTVRVTGAEGTGLSLLLSGFEPGGPYHILFRVISVLTLTTGTVFIMWLGEQITARGIGNGTSLIIFSGIVSRIPQTAFAEAEQYISGVKPWALLILVLAMIIVIMGFIIFIEQGNRRIPLESPRRVVGRNVLGGQKSYLPFKVNTGGVIPVIFASSLLFIPSMIASMFPNVTMMSTFASQFQQGAITYSVVFALMITFFNFFYTAIQYNPQDIADNLKKSGSFIPGVRPGRKTAEYIDFILTRITLPGALFLAIISVVPLHLKAALNMSFYIGGTSVLITVGVALDTLRQIEAHLHSRNYDGFLKKGRIRGRMPV